MEPADTKSAPDLRRKRARFLIISISYGAACYGASHVHADQSSYKHVTCYMRSVIKQHLPGRNGTSGYGAAVIPPDQSAHIVPSCHRIDFQIDICKLSVLNVTEQADIFTRRLVNIKARYLMSASVVTAGEGIFKVTYGLPFAFKVPGNRAPFTGRLLSRAISLPVSGSSAGPRARRPVHRCVH